MFSKPIIHNNISFSSPTDSLSRCSEFIQPVMFWKFIIPLSRRTVIEVSLGIAGHLFESNKSLNLPCCSVSLKEKDWSKPLHCSICKLALSFLEFRPAGDHFQGYRDKKKLSWITSRVESGQTAYMYALQNLSGRTASS